IRFDEFSGGEHALQSLRVVLLHRATPPMNPALPRTWPAIGVVIKRNRTARAILIHVLHDGSKKPTPTRSKLGPTTPALVAACIRIKKSGRRRTPHAAINVMMEPKKTKKVASHISMSVLPII